MIQVPPPVNELGARARVVHDAMWMAYVYAGLSAEETAEQLNRELKTRETRGSILSYAFRQKWDKAQIIQPPAPLPLPKSVAAPRPAPAAPPPKPERPRGPATLQAPPLRPPEPKEVDLAAMARPPGDVVFGLVRAIDLMPAHCKWPIGHPGTESFRHCGEPRDGTAPYCKTHKAKAWK